MQESSIARQVKQDPLPEAGKISLDIFQQVILPHLGAARSEVIVGPRHGVDTAIVDLGGDQVMSISTDPFYIVPEYGWDRAAWFAVNIVASDAATSGLRPAYCAIDLNLPLSMNAEQLSAMWEATDAACREIGMAIVTGHTARYDGCDYPMLGGATVMGVGSRLSYVTPEMAMIGDAVVMTKGAAIETTGTFGVTFPERLTADLGSEMARAAEALFYQMSVVKDAMTAVQVGVRQNGVTAMHDATERGVLGGLHEIAVASGTGLIVDRDAIPVFPEARAICALFDMDPYTASSEGTLLLTCRPHRVSVLIDRLANEGIFAERIGEITPPDHGIRIVENGQERELVEPAGDPFWPAFRKALEEQRG